MKRVVQAIGNTKFGGVISGLIDSYQEPVSVKRLPMKATKKTMINARIRTFQFIFILFSNPLTLTVVAFTIKVDFFSITVKPLAD